MSRWHLALACSAYTRTFFVQRSAVRNARTTMAQASQSFEGVDVCNGADGPRLAVVAHQESVGRHDFFAPVDQKAVAQRIHQRVTAATH